MNNKEACAAYFKERPEFSRIFAAMRKKWESLGRTGGKIVLSHAAEEERKALEGFLGIPMPEQKIVFSITEFEQALQETKYGPISLKELLELYFDGILVGNQEKKLQRKSREQEFWAALKGKLEIDGTEYAEAVSWMEEMQEKKNNGYAAVMREYRRSETSAEELLFQTARCLSLCGGQSLGIRLSVLAARVTGNPHALDRQTTLGTLLSYALCRRSGSEFPQNARMWKDLYEKNGILADDLSSTVTAYGIHLLTDRRLHPAYEGYLAEKEPFVISMANLGRAKSAWGESERVFIVENEMVFSELLEKISAYPVTLLCTSGQPRTAAYQLMEMLCESGCSFSYAGDLDPEGLDIADRIWRSFPGHVHIWRMDEDDYHRAMSSEEVSERRLEILKGLSNPELKKTAECIFRYKRAGYQEMLLEDMAKDIVKYFQ